MQTGGCRADDVAANRYATWRTYFDVVPAKVPVFCGMTRIAYHHIPIYGIASGDITQEATEDFA